MKDAVTEQAAKKPPRGVIGPEEVRQAAQVLQKYKEGKANLEQRIIGNEQWYKLLHWGQLRQEGKAGTGECEPTSAWLFNSIATSTPTPWIPFPSPTSCPGRRGTGRTPRCSPRCCR